MRAMDFDGIDADTGRARRGRSKGLANAHKASRIQRLRRFIAGSERQGRGRPRAPAAFARRAQLPAQPGWNSGCLAAGMRQLHCNRHGRMPAHLRQRGRQRLLVLI